MKTAVVLTIEDEPSVSDVIRTALTYAGFKVLTAGNAAEGIECARAERPHLILLDLMLPDINGYSFFDLLEEYGLHETPIIIVSGCATPEAQSLGRNLGACDYVTKPFSVHDLVRRVENVLARGNTVARTPKRSRARAKK